MTTRQLWDIKLRADAAQKVYVELLSMGIKAETVRPLADALSDLRLMIKEMKGINK